VGATRSRGSSLAPDSPVPFWALIAFTFILFIAPQAYLPMLKPLHLALIAAIVAIGSFVFERLSRGLPVVVLHRENVLILLLLFWIMITLPLSYWIGGSIQILVGLYLKTLIVYWLLSHVVTTGQRLRRIAWALTLMAIPIALTALWHFLAGDFIERGLRPDELRIIGYDAPLTGNPNDLALTLNLFLPLAVGLFLGSRNPVRRALLLGCICLDAVAVIATFSRGGFLTLCVVCLVYMGILFRRGYRQLPFLAMFLALAVLPLLPAGYINRLSTIAHISTDPSGSAQTRWSDTLAAAKYVITHPVIGAGIGNDKLALNQVRGATWTEVHDAYLEFGVDLGLPGMILFLLLLRGFLRRGRAAQRRLARKGSDPQQYYLAEGIRVSLIAFCIAAFFHPIAYHFFFYIFAALALAVDTMAKSTGPDTGSLGRHLVPMWYVAAPPTPHL